MAKSGTCQIKQISQAAIKNSDAIIYHYSFTSTVDDTITVKIVDPRGELVKIAYRNQPVMTNESIDFSLNTNFWRQGKYQIIVDSKKTGPVTKGLTIKPKNFQKKSEK
jgi:hypothetical protein